MTESEQTTIFSVPVCWVSTSPSGCCCTAVTGLCGAHCAAANGIRARNRSAERNIVFFMNFRGERRIKCVNSTSSLRVSVNDYNKGFCWTQLPFRGTGKASSCVGQPLAAVPTFCCPRLFLHYFQRDSLCVGGVGTDHYVEYSWLDYAVHVDVENRKSIRREFEFDGGLLAGIQVHAAEGAEFLHRLRDGGDFLVNVELGDFVSGACAGVGDVYGNSRCLAGPDGRGRDAEVVEMESAVAQAVAEGE